jgi:hypothetical protein
VINLKLITSFILGFAAAYLYEILAYVLAMNIFHQNNPGLIIGGYRLHHSLYGLLFLIFGVAQKKEFYLGFGLGIIVQHTMYDGFWLISREF